MQQQAQRQRQREVTRPAQEAPKRSLTAFDLSALVVGAVVGADIYVAANLTTPLVGAASLALWALAGAVAFVIALNFAACAQMAPSEGGVYAYTRDAYGEAAGFYVGWALLLSQLIGAALFPNAFLRYLSDFTGPFPGVATALLKVAFIGVVLAVNLLPAGKAGRLGGVLAALKLLPLALLLGLGVVATLRSPGEAAGHFQPLVTGGPMEFATAFIVIFWAYTGFEVATLPASEVQKPKRSIPIAIAVGLGVSLVAYLLVNAALLAILPQPAIGATSAPLVVAARAIGGPLAGVALGLGAMVSIFGANQSGLLGGSRLAHALAADGYLPAPMARRTSSGVPVVALVALSLGALLASLTATLQMLIGATVFFVALSFIAACLSALALRKKDPFGVLRSPLLPIVGLALSVGLLLSTGWLSILVGSALMLLGVPVYLRYAPKRGRHPLVREWTARHPSVRSAQQQVNGLFAAPAWWIAKRRQAK